MNKWAGMGAGVGFSIGVVREIFFQALIETFTISDLLLLSLAFAFAGGIIGALFFGIFSVTTDVISKIDNPVLKGVFLVFVPLGMCVVFDLALLRGTLVFVPLMSFLLNGDIQGTYYTCADWVSGSEGPYCNDE